VSEGKSSPDQHSHADGDGMSPVSSPTLVSQSFIYQPVRSTVKVPTQRELGLDTSYGPIRFVATIFQEAPEQKRDDILSRMASANVAATAIRTLVNLGILHKNGYLSLTERGSRYVAGLGTPVEQQEFRKALNDHAPFRHLLTHLRETCSPEGFSGREAIDSWLKALSAQGSDTSAKKTIRGSMLVFLNLARASGFLNRPSVGADYTFAGTTLVAGFAPTQIHGVRLSRVSRGSDPVPLQIERRIDPKIRAVLRKIVRAAIHSTDPQLKQWAVEILDAEGLTN
jgi:hypothetical protein